MPTLAFPCNMKTCAVDIYQNHLWDSGIVVTFASHKSSWQNPCGLKFKKMKKGIHPESYRFVVFKDMSNGHTFLTRSAAPSKEMIVWEDGNEYPVIKMEISNMSHPFFTGQNILVDTAGRIDKFKKKYAKKA